MKTRALVIAVAAISFASQTAFADDCSGILHAGTTYRLTHWGGVYTWSGPLRIEHVYACEMGTCFSGLVRFDGSYPDWNNVTGFFSGDSLQFVRNVQQETNVQTFAGTCYRNGARGTWHYITGPGDNSAGFTISM
jgi:hypothetical protein